MLAPSNSDRILIGVGVWSRYDLELLDRLQPTITERKQPPLIYVFDVEECKHLNDFEHYVPGIGRVYQTPIVGIWRDGFLTSSGWGAAGRELLAHIGLLE